ncbi:bacteriocin-protection protein [Chitinophaga sp. Mgbs1]|uniref:Bacteriocin-protection protein n=1 Tax=Chitinophaga solisilvae TaxID=1233460 RepID=A0A3S1BIU1_9BACT|nr:bacteriocin-protection protein [Chitinophaga solisilvae]
MKPTFFEKAADFRKWLDKNHSKAAELIVGFYKTSSGRKSMTWSESVDQALCYGWIDAVRKSIDEESYYIRFCPRKPNSIWSAINLKKVEDLTAQGLMMPAGLAVFRQRNESRTNIYSHENEARSLSPAYEQKFRARKKAWEFFESQAPSYIKVSIHWVMSAKQAATQESRLDKLIAESAAGKRMR